MFKEGFIEVSPSLSQIIEENPHIDDLGSDMIQQKPIAISAFIEDSTVHTALRKGFRLSTFRLMSEKGAEFEYAIQNVNELLVPYKIEQILQQKAGL